MYLGSLELVDFRSYAHAEVTLSAGISVFIGANAQGKTNLLEAVHYLSTGGSHRVASDAPLVRAGCDAAVVRAAARDRGRQVRIELELRPGGRSRARVNGQAQTRFRSAIGHIRAVLFAPEDLALVRGDPGERRRFLDDLLGQRRPAYVAVRQEYERVVKQRTALLRTLRGAASGRVEATTLSTWDTALIQTGATLLAARIAVVHALAGPTETAYRDLVATSPAKQATGAVGVGYQLSTGRLIAGEAGSGIPDPSLLAEELRQGLVTMAEAERERGLTLVGPHRDDLVLTLNDLPAKGYASHGETWSLALALRLASREVLVEVGAEPIVMLDDVFAELDEQRRSRLASRCGTFEQVLVTAAVDGDVPLDGRRHRVAEGAVMPASWGQAEVEQ